MVWKKSQISQYYNTIKDVNITAFFKTIFLFYKNNRIFKLKHHCTGLFYTSVLYAKCHWDILANNGTINVIECI